MRPLLLPLALLAAGLVGACSMADRMQAPRALAVGSTIMLAPGEEVLVSSRAMDDYTCGQSQQLRCDVFGSKYRCRCVRWRFASDVDVFGATR